MPNHLKLSNLWKASISIIQRRNELMDNMSDSVQFSVREENNTTCAVWVNMKSKSSRQIKIDFIDSNVSLDIPKCTAASKVALQFCYFPIDYNQSELEDEDMLIIGGTFELKVINLPLAISHTEEWSMCLAYSSQTKNPTDSNRSVDNDNTGQARRSSMMKQEVKCHFVAANDTIVPEVCKMARMNEENQVWTTDGVELAKFNRSQRMLTFCMNIPGKYALINDRLLDLPYKTWSVYPQNCETITFSLQTSRFTLLFSISNSGCRLLAPDIIELRNITQCRNDWKPYELLHQLQIQGIHLLPSQKDQKRLGYPRKADGLEQTVYKDISFCAPSCHFRFCKHESNSLPNQIYYEFYETGIFAGREVLDETGKFLARTEVDSLSKSALNAQNSVKLPTKCGDIKVTLIEIDEGQSPNYPINMDDDNDELHSSICLFSAFKRIGTEESIQRISDSKTTSLRNHYLHQMLELTRPILFSGKS